MDGTAVARIVASIATSPVVSIRAIRMGPRSERKPTLARVISFISVNNRSGPGSFPLRGKESA